ncbi:MAG: cobaltochelatase subunit CobN [Ferrimicrobium sp.]
MATVVYLTNADTEILALRSVWEELPAEVRVVSRSIESIETDLVIEELVSNSDVVVMRLLGGSRSTPHFDAILAVAMSHGVPVVCFPGEVGVDDELMRASSVPAWVWKEGFRYLVQGGVFNFEHFLRFICDTLAGTEVGFHPAREIPSFGLYRTNEETIGDEEVARVGVIFYRAHLIAGNTVFIDRLLKLASARGVAMRAYYTYSLRSDSSEIEGSIVDELARDGLDAVVTTVLAGGHAEGLTWDAGALGALDAPVVQAVVSTSSRASWQDRDSGLSPMDVAMNIAIPEFDGRIIGPPIAFKEVVDDDVSFGAPIVGYRLDDERADRLIGYLIRLARLRRRSARDKRVALVLSAYPTKRSRLGNAVGLDTPASLLRLAAAMREEGYDISELPEDSNQLMAQLGELIDYDHPSTVARGGLSLGAAEYERWFEGLPESVRDAVIAAWGPPPGEVYLRDGRLWFPALSFGNLTIAIQPPRGFGENPIAVYHSPELVPTHHYLAFYHYLESELDVDAVVHLGKHGTLEWLPGKSVGLSKTCYPDITQGTLPLIYPFVINDPGEGTQAKRRSHAVLIGHLVPPMTRAESYGDLATLEMLMDEHQRIAALDPAKLPVIRAQIWELLESARLHEDLGVDDRPGFEDDSFDELLLDVDGYLCELKDALIRGGLHLLGQAPEGIALIDMIASITRVPQLGVPALRPLLSAEADERTLSAGRDEAQGRVEDLLWAYFGAGFAPQVLSDESWLASVGLVAPLSAELESVLRWIGEVLVPDLLATSDEVPAVLRALGGVSIAPGPSGAPTRGMAHALPTGRNFYSIDPRSIPTRISYLTGTRLASGIVERYRSVHDGLWPSAIGLVLWGTAAIRTGGDDIATALALVGVEPIWDPTSNRVTDLRLLSLEELGRPRVEVTCRISGFFRDAFPAAVALLDEAFSLAAKEEGEGVANPLAATGNVPRIFGPAPRSYGAGILPLLETRAWKDDGDLAEVYLTWSGYSYSRDVFGRPDRDQLEAQLGRIDVALKTQDNREHDIFDSDDYLQEHGGMIAAARALGNREVAGYFGDSADAANPRIRSIEEEAARVVRSRVVNPKWIAAMMRHGYKGAFELAATVDYLFGYDATAKIGRDWMYDAVSDGYVDDDVVRDFLLSANPGALGSICERLLEANGRGMWKASPARISRLKSALMQVEGDIEETR